jgi:hypothetical protein
LRDLVSAAQAMVKGDDARALALIGEIGSIRPSV